MTTARCIPFCYGAALVTLPWVGMDVLKLATGRDWGGGLQPSWLFLALAMGCALVARVRRTAPEATLARSLDGPTWWRWGLLATVVALLLSILGLWLAPVNETLTVTLGRYLKQVIQLAIMISFTAWVAWWTRGPERWAWTIKLLLIGGLIQVGYGILQAVSYYLPSGIFTWLDAVATSNPSIQSGSDELYLADAFRQVPRLRGTVCEPLYLGNYLLFLWPLVLVPVWSVRRRRLLAVALGFLLLGTWSRGAWLGLVGQIGLLVGMLLALGPGAGRALGLEVRHLRKALLAGVVIAAVVPVVGWLAGLDGLLYPYRRLAQTFSGQDWSNLTRLYSMQAGWRAFLLSPAVGIGWGQFGWHFPLLVDPLGLQSQFSWPVVNNFPLLILCETGLVGFLVYAGWVVGLIRDVGRRWFSLRGAAPDSPAARSGVVLLATVLAVSGVWLQLLTFSQYNLPHIWVGPGLLLAALADPSFRKDQG